MGTIDRAAEEAIARLAAANEEIVERSRLLDEGIARAAIDRRVQSGRLRVQHPGVYFAGHGEPSRMQIHLAAVMASGVGAASGSASAAEVWRMLSASPGPPHVVRCGPRRRGPAGIVVHHASRLPASEVTMHRGIPVTTPARTLLDLAAVDHPGLELAHSEARAVGLIRRTELDPLTASGRRGAARLRALLEEAPGYTREAAERILRMLILKARLPFPAFNAVVQGRRRDAVWGERRVVLEVDGYAAHGHRAVFERDRLRDQELAAAGFVTIRVTWLQLLREPEALVARLAGALAHASRRVA